MLHPGVVQSELASASQPAVERMIAERLGGETIIGRKVESLNDLVVAITAGLPIEAWEQVRRSGRFTQQELDAVIPPRTLRHRKAHGRRLTADESDRAVRLLRLQASAELVFGDVEKADLWLRRPMAHLDGKRPLELAATEAGARLVEGVLDGIAWGTAA